MRIAICDDEAPQRQLLTKYLQEWAREQHLLLETVPFCDAEGFLFQWEDDKAFDLLVLDIEMGAVSGMELAMRLRDAGEEVPVLFITGYESYMAQGYEVAALHYLLKPVHKEKLFAVLDRLQRTVRTEEKILFQTEEGSVSLVPSDIWYVEAAGHQCVMTTGRGFYLLKHSFTETKQLLDKYNKGIVACHRSYLVNLQHVSAIVKAEIVMDNGSRIPVSRSCAKGVNEAFIKHYA